MTFVCVPSSTPELYIWYLNHATEIMNVVVWIAYFLFLFESNSSFTLSFISHIISSIYWWFFSLIFKFDLLSFSFPIFLLFCFFQNLFLLIFHSDYWNFLCKLVYFSLKSWIDIFISFICSFESSLWPLIFQSYRVLFLVSSLLLRAQSPVSKRGENKPS
jgi:hypothetical protein